MGYVEHEAPEMFIDSILISIAPFIINSAVAVLLFRWGMGATGLVKFAVFWLGLSVALHSFPSSGDANQIWNYAKKHLLSFWTLLAIPIILLIKTVDRLRILWFDLVYAIILMLFAITKF